MSVPKAPEQLQLGLEGDEDFDLSQNTYNALSVEEKILETVQSLLDRSMPLDDRLWDHRIVAQYMGVSIDTAKRALRKPGAPEPIKIPSSADCYVPARYVGSEVRQWCERRLRFEAKRRNKRA